MIKKKVAHFAFIGAIAFVFDSATYFIAGLLFLFLLGQHVPFAQKIVGFVAGVLTTYLYNSRVTFPVAYSWNRFCKYLGSQFFGMALNLGVFLLLSHVFPVFMALTGATLIGALANFLGARYSLRPN